MGVKVHTYTWHLRAAFDVERTMLRFFPQLFLTSLVFKACTGSSEPTRVPERNIDVSASPYIMARDGEFFVNGR